MPRKNEQGIHFEGNVECGTRDRQREQGSDRAGKQRSDGTTELEKEGQRNEWQYGK